MDRSTLVNSAGRLPELHPESIRAYAASKDKMLARMNEKMKSRKDINEIVGESNLEMMEDNHANHLRFIESMFIAYDPEVMVDTILWVFRAYRSRNFSSTYWAAQLNNWLLVFKEELSEKCYADIFPYYEWMQVNIPSFVTLSDEKLTEPGFSLH